MQVSVIIVSYNVKYFLEHCLLSVLRASNGMQVEVIVVDNCSTDGSVDMLQQKFPSVMVLANKDNVGFAKANNQGVAKANGKYILYLNPDTILPEDCLAKCFAYMEDNKEVGALGCRLIDGKGHFLPESKRGFPSAHVAFCKIAGLSTLFPTSTYFNKYHLGYLPELEIAEVDVLVGCFMFCRKSVIDKVNGFDEDYFMYGEDIDLSFKIKSAGYTNVYFPETTVIHYKGESTKKGSLNYVKMFYKAMIIFAKKHFSGSNQTLYVLLIHLAIYVRACMAFVIRIFSIIQLPLLDAVSLAGSLWVMKTLWIRNVKTDTFYSTQLLVAFFGSYIFCWILSIYFNGGYDKPYKPNRILRGMLVGGLISVAVYGLLPETIRFSRGITVLGALLGTLMILLSRKLLQWLHVEQVSEEGPDTQKIILVATPEEEEEIRRLLHQATIDKTILGSVSPLAEKQAFQLGTFLQLKPMAQLYGATEIIYSQQHIGFKHIIDSMQECGSALYYKLHSTGTMSIIGSNSKNTAGDLYSTELIFKISSPEAKRNKRLVDIIFSLFFLLLSPIFIWFVQNKSSYFLHHVLVLEGDKTYVGYDDLQFPKLKPCLTDVFPEIENFIIPNDNKEHLNWLYAKNYSAWQDVQIILTKWRNL